jgi:hypothetical protein
LEKAFQGLSGVVGSLETAFTGLVNNGIELFAAAAPGAQTAIDGIGSFFSKFNWTRLGAAAGSALRGLGDSLSSIPPATVEKITTSFEGLGAELNSPEFKAGMQGFADATPLLVGSLQLMAKEFAAAGKDVGDFARDLTALGTGSAFVDLGSQLGQLSDKLGLTTDAQQRFLDKVNEKPSAPLAPEVVAKSFEGLTPILNGSMLGAQNALKTGLAPLPGLALAGFAAITPAAQGGLNPLINTVRVAADQSSAAFEQGFANLPQVTAKQLNAADAQVQRVLGPGGTMVAGFGTGMRQLSPIMQQELGLLGPQVDTSLAPLPVSVTTATQAMADAANAAIPGLGTAFQTGFAALGPLIDTAFLALNTANIPLALTAMCTAITTGLTTLVGPAFTLGFQTLGPILDQAFLLLSTTNITAGLTAMGTAITTGFATLLGPAFTLGFATLGPILDAAFLLLSTTNITAGMTAIGLAVTTGLTTLVGPAFTTGFAALGATAVTPGMVAVAAAVTAGFAQVVAAVTAGMAQANAAAGTGFTQLVQVATDSGNQVVQVITDAMAKFVQAVTDGGAKAVEALKQVGEQMKSAIDVNILVPVGEQISAGLARGIANGGSAVTAAAVKVVRDAAAAANNAAQVKSPSRLTMPTGRGMSQGIEVGLLTGGADVVAAAEKVVRDALAVMDASTFSSGSFAGDLGARLSSAVFASAGDFTNSPVIAFSHTTVLDGDVVEQSVKRVTASETRNLRQRMKAG